jgi:hypothetical protein
VGRDRPNWAVHQLRSALPGPGGPEYIVAPVGTVHEL